MNILNEIYRINQLMGLRILNETYTSGIDEILKKLFSISDSSIKNSSESAQSVLKQFVGGTGSYDDIADYVARQTGGVKSIDNVVDFIKGQPEIMDSLIKSSDEILKKSASDIFKTLNLRQILTQESYEDIESLMFLKITKNNKNSVISFIDNAITDLTPKKGLNPNIDELIKKLEDRKKLAQGINVSTTVKTTENFVPSPTASSFLENFAYTNKSFIQMISGKPMSGWKIHVYGEDIGDSVYLITKLDDFLKSQNASYKIATDKFYKNSKNTIQQGKGLTIYIPYDIVKQGKQNIFFDEINSKISDYKKSGTIQGDKAYNDKIHYRYEYNKPFDALPEGGVSINDASKYYVDNQGDYMSGTGNLQPDLFKRTQSDNVVKSVTTNMLSGKRISNRSFVGQEQNINWGDVKNAKNMDDYNMLIAQAIQTGDYRYISSKGFEKFGIGNFREFLINNIDRVYDLDANTGRWSVQFK